MKRMHETNGRYMDVHWRLPRMGQPSAIKLGIAAKMPNGSVIYSDNKEVLFCKYENVDGENRWHYFRKPNGPLGTENHFTFSEDVSTATRVMVDIEPYIGPDEITSIPTAEITNVDPDGKTDYELAKDVSKRVMIVEPVTGNLTCLGSGYNPDNPSSSSADIKSITITELTENYKDAKEQITKWYKDNKASDIYYDDDEGVNFAILNKGTEWQTNPNLPKIISVSWRAFPPEVIHTPKMGIYMLPVDYLEI